MMVLRTSRLHKTRGKTTIASVSPSRSRSISAVWLLVSLVGVVLLSWRLSEARRLWYDEILAWNLLTDPSWRHVVDSWNHGADSGGLLFYALGRPLVFGFGHHVFPIRLASAVGLWMSGVLWWQMLRRRTSDLVAGFAVGLVFLGNATLLNYVAEVRFYGLLILTTTMAVYAAFWIEQTQTSRKVAFFLCFVANGLLVSSHMLGVVYSAAIVVALLVSSFPRSLKPAAMLGSMASWSLLLTYRKAIHAGASKLNWIPMPHAIDLVRYYLHRPTEYRPGNGVLWLLLLYGAYTLWQGRGKHAAPSFETTFSLLMLLVPIEFYVVSHVYKPIFAERYMIPYLLGFGYVAGRALWMVVRPHRPSVSLSRRAAAAVALGCLVWVSLASVREQALRPNSDLAQLLSLDPGCPLVIPNDRLFLEARYQQGNITQYVTYLMPRMTSAVSDTAILTTLVKQGYAAHVYEEPAFIAAHTRFLYLDMPRDTDVYSWTIADDPTLKTTRTGTVVIANTPVPLLLVERR